MQNNIEIIKTHADIPNYEFSSNGKYRRVGTEKWYPKEQPKVRYSTFAFKNKDGKVVTKLLHRTIKEVFDNVKIPVEMEIDHKDRNTHNNNIKNLDIVDISASRKNRDHAFLTKARNNMKDSIKIIKTTDSKGKVMYFQSKRMAGKFHGINAGHVFLATGGKYADNSYNGVKYEINKDEKFELTKIQRPNKKYNTVEEKRKAIAERAKFSYAKKKAQKQALVDAKFGYSLTL
jgi:hypothetical protein